MDRILSNTIISKLYNKDIGMTFAFCYNYSVEGDRHQRYKTKLTNINNMLQSSFASVERKNKNLEFLGVYNKYIKSFSIIQNIWRRKKYSTFDYDYDLTMNPLSDYNEKDKMTFIQNKTIYTFTISDMLNVIYNSLMQCEYLQQKPGIPKNPFNNLPFSDAILLKLYVHCRLNNISMDYFVKQYYKCDFCLQAFGCRNHFKLSENAIKNYIYYTTEDTLYDEIFNMFYYIDTEDYTFSYNIRDDIQLISPYVATDQYKIRIVNTCKKMLLPYFMHLYKTQHDARVNNYYINTMMDYLKKFIDTYGTFWRKKLKPRKQKKTWNFEPNTTFKFNFDVSRNAIDTNIFNFDASQNEIISSNTFTFDISRNPFVFFGSQNDATNDNVDDISNNNFC